MMKPFPQVIGVRFLPEFRPTDRMIVATRMTMGLRIDDTVPWTIPNVSMHGILQNLYNIT
jgi:hypothetical protein